jgi:glycosyltransferase involved in cell wall biosynthesis
MDGSLRLLGFGNGYPPEVIGGYPEVAGDVMEGLASRGHAVTMLVSPRTLPRGAGGPDGTLVQVRRELDYVLAPWRRPLRGLRAVVHDQKVVESVLAQGVDAAIVWHMRGVMKTSLRIVHDAGIPVLYMLHDRWVLYERAGPWLKPWPVIDRMGLAAARETAARLARRRVALGAPPIERQGIVCFVTKWLQDEYSRLGFEPRQARVIPGGFDLDPFLTAGLTRPAAVPPRRLVFAGRVDWRKGLDTAVSAIAKAGIGHRLIIAGPVDDEAYAGRVVRVARKLGIEDQVEWRGPLARTALPSLFAECDAMVYPSVEPESYGLGLIEAMAARRPVLTSALGGPREYLEDGRNALLFEPGNADALAAGLTSLEERPDLATKLAEAGEQTARNHSLESAVDAVEDVLRARRSVVGSGA